MQDQVFVRALDWRMGLSGAKSNNFDFTGLTTSSEIARSTSRLLRAMKEEADITYSCGCFRNFWRNWNR